MRQFYLEIDPQNPPRPGQTVALDKDESHHLFTVLRGGRDVCLNLVDGCGTRLTGRPNGKKGKLALVTIETVNDDPTESQRPRLVLACSVVKGKRFELVLEKAVELGVHDIIPVLSEHGVIDPGQGKRDRWLGLLKSALKQSGRSWLPSLSEPVKLDQLLSQDPGLALFGAVPGELDDAVAPVVNWADRLQTRPVELPPTLTLYIGPEGGWAETELRAFLAAGAQGVNLGPHILRTETAALAGLALCQTLRQQWQGMIPG